MLAHLSAEPIHFVANGPGFGGLHVARLQIPRPRGLDRGERVQVREGPEYLRCSGRGCARDGIVHALEHNAIDVGAGESDEMILRRVHRAEGVHTIIDQRLEASSRGGEQPFLAIPECGGLEFWISQMLGIAAPCDHGVHLGEAHLSPVRHVAHDSPEP